MARPFRKLRVRIMEKGMSHADAAQTIDCSPCAFSIKLNGKTNFTQSEMYALSDALDFPPEEFHLYFPRNGQNEPGCRRAMRPVRRLRVV